MLGGNLGSLLYGNVSVMYAGNDVTRMCDQMHNFKKIILVRLKTLKNIQNTKSGFYCAISNNEYIHQ